MTNVLSAYGANRLQSLRLFGGGGGNRTSGDTIQTILERFRGQVSMRTRPNNTNKTRYRTFL